MIGEYIKASPHGRQIFLKIPRPRVENPVVLGSEDRCACPQKPEGYSTRR